MSAALQWGHRFSSVESRRYLVVPCVAGDASMGPPIFIGGKAERHFQQKNMWQASMGPPIFIGGKGPGIPVIGVTLALQWGHRFSSVERTKAPTEDRDSTLASMGPPIFIGGKWENRNGR